MGHLTADKRRRWETLLNRSESFRSIAEALEKSHSTILRFSPKAGQLEKV
ncbi:MAG: helix-turn-helix domain-containing protein [Lentisphaeria bacterium]|nr:helix-turn-helix domain-containing protein [Lentisphaeria bacterium]